MSRNRKSDKKLVFYVRNDKTDQEKSYERDSIDIPLQRLMREKNSRKY